jgi:hypothetical protein
MSVVGDLKHDLDEAEHQLLAQLDCCVEFKRRL